MIWTAEFVSANMLASDLGPGESLDRLPLDSTRSKALPFEH